VRKSHAAVSLGPICAIVPYSKLSFLRCQVREMCVDEVLEAVTSYLIYLANYHSGFIKIFMSGN